MIIFAFLLVPYKCSPGQCGISGVGAQPESLEVECQAVFLQGRQDLVQGLEMMIPMLVVDDDTVDVY